MVIIIIIIFSLSLIFGSWRRRCRITASQGEGGGILESSPPPSPPHDDCKQLQRQSIKTNEYTPRGLVLTEWREEKEGRRERDLLLFPYIICVCSCTVYTHTHNKTGYINVARISDLTRQRLI